MEKNLRKFSKVLQIVAIVFAVITILVSLTYWENRKTIAIFGMLVTIVFGVLVHMPIKVMIKTVIVAVSIVFVNLGYISDYTRAYILLYLPLALVIQLINSWLRELAHLDSPKQDKIDKLKKRLESLESDDKQE